MALRLGGASAGAAVLVTMLGCAAGRSVGRECSPSHERGQVVVRFREGTDTRSKQEVFDTVRLQVPDVAGSFSAGPEGPGLIGILADASPNAVRDLKKTLVATAGVVAVEPGPCPLEEDAAS